MKGRNLFFGIAAMVAASVSVASCSNEDVLDGKASDGRTPITLTSNIAKSRAISQNIQRTQIASGVNVGVFVQSAATGNAVVADNSIIAADGNGGFTGNPIYYPEDGSQVNIYAYAPYSSAWDGNLANDVSFSVSSDQTEESGYTASDLLWGTPLTNPVTPTDAAVAIAFSHKLTKLNINFDTDAAPGIDLAGATVSVVNTLPTTTLNVATGEIAEQASGTATAITAAEFTADATEFTASAIIVPQTIQSGTNLVSISLADGTTVNADLNQTVAFEGGKEYTYTVNFNADGTAALTLTETIKGWEDGYDDLTGGTEEVVTYGVGDFVTYGGGFIKAGDVTDDNRANIAAIIFSTNVSTTDKDDGYDAYAMNVQSTGNKGWVITDVITTSVTDYSVALADMDGLSHTNDVLGSAQYATLKEEQDEDDSNNFGKCIFECLPRVGVGLQTVSGGSGWFVPSFGQMVEVLNNLGNAGISSETTLDENNPGGAALYKSADLAAINAVNKHFTDAGFANGPLSNGLYITTTESGLQFWNINVTSDHFEFGRSAYKSGTNRRAATCVAVSLPD